MEDINNTGDKVWLFGCGTNITYAITELGLMYVCGMYLDEEFDCMFYPTMFMLPDDIVI